MRIQEKLAEAFKEGLKAEVAKDFDSIPVSVQRTRPDFNGDFTINVFPFVKMAGTSPQILAGKAGERMAGLPEVESWEVVQGFLNLSLRKSYWNGVVNDLNSQGNILPLAQEKPGTFLVEYSSPNTNKPLHLGHIRNNLLGDSISRILEANGHKVLRLNLVNDRGIHICKSMLAWKKWGNGDTPEATGKKGDKLVGDYYVRFDKELKAEISELTANGKTPEQAEKESALMAEVREMLVLWEDGHKETLELWARMNGWVYQGFEKTYQRLGISFYKTYYESQTYSLGKKIVLDGLSRGIFKQNSDGSIWVDLTGDGMDEKLLLRSDGTSVYITQDIGTAVQRMEEFLANSMFYVVGNEQNYHFQVLKLVLSKLGYDWAEKLSHISYGMVELPEGKMKSREGTVVDADDLMDGMEETARTISAELGKLEGLAQEEKAEIIRKIGMGALKYFILRVDPKKNMLFDPKESIDFDGNTGPFIQYTLARINSVLRKAVPSGDSGLYEAQPAEISLIKLLYQFSETVRDACDQISPSLIANYCYNLAREFNVFYHQHSILNDENEEARAYRINLTKATGKVLKEGMELLGIEMPERM